MFASPRLKIVGILPWWSDACIRWPRDSRAAIQLCPLVPKLSSWFYLALAQTSLQLTCTSIRVGQLLGLLHAIEDEAIDPKITSVAMT